MICLPSRDAGWNNRVSISFYASSVYSSQGPQAYTGYLWSAEIEGIQQKMDSTILLRIREDFYKDPFILSFPCLPEARWQMSAWLYCGVDMNRPWPLSSEVIPALSQTVSKQHLECVSVAAVLVLPATKLNQDFAIMRRMTGTCPAMNCRISGRPMFCDIICAFIRTLKRMNKVQRVSFRTRRLPVNVIFSWICFALC